MKLNTLHNEPNRPLYDALINMRPLLAAAAQGVYNAWQQDENDNLNGGGICQDIAEAMAGVILEAGYDAQTIEAQVGEQHVWTVAYTDKEAYHVDMSYSLYERGGGYTWKKIDGVIFDPDWITITPADRDVIGSY